MTTNPTNENAETTVEALRRASAAMYAGTVAVMQQYAEVAKAKKRRAMREQQTFRIPEVAKLTGLNEFDVYLKIIDQEIEANEVPSGWMIPGGWYIPREEVWSLVRRHAAENNCQAGLDFLAAIDETDEVEDEQYSDPAPAHHRRRHSL